jgi:hypothetical protein
MENLNKNPGNPNKKLKLLFQQIREIQIKIWENQT